MWSPESTGALDIVSTVPQNHSVLNVEDQKVDNHVDSIVSSTGKPLDDFTKFILRGCRLKVDERISEELNSGFCGDM